MKAIDKLRRSLFCCFCAKCTTASTSANSTVFAFPAANTTNITIKNRLSATLTDLFKDRKEPQDCQDEDDSFIDAAAGDHHRPVPSPSRGSRIVGTIFGHRRGHVSFCVQQDPSTPPPILFELSMPTHLLAREMRTGLLRIALECHRDRDRHQHPSSAQRLQRSAAHVWMAYCNGRKVGYAVRRRPTEKDLLVLHTMRSTTAGAGVLFQDEEEGELMYMRASYERVVGSRDSVSYHLLNPGGSPGQDLSVFLLRTD